MAYEKCMNLLEKIKTLCLSEEDTHQLSPINAAVVINLSTIN